MTPILQHLKDNILPHDGMEAQKIWTKAEKYALDDEAFLRKCFTKSDFPLLVRLSCFSKKYARVSATTA